MFVIRADGNAKTGAGHLMRCLTIAQAIERRGEASEILFLCADEDSAKMVRVHGFRAEVLHTDYRDMESELRGDAGQNRDVSNAVGKTLWDIWIKGTSNRILVDSYYVTDAYLKGLKRYGRVFLMDDMQNHTYPADGVINYNLFADSELYAKLYEGKDVRLCLGSGYVPLRQQFRDVAYQVRDVVEEVLLTTGGGDADNIAGSILDAVYRENIRFHVLVGRFSPHFENWQRRVEQTPNLEIHFDVKNMAELMTQCDLAITAGGSTVYELAAVGVPFICFSYAGNQEALVDYMDRENVSMSAGAWHRDAAATLERMSGQFVQLCENVKLRRQCSDRERRLIDGQGAERLAEILTAM